ncbi:hypothetical protein A1D29_06995 [Pasteurellaceae bacterium Orientalotternb1]|nr:hypothetical protein A1D29_06995 [Pasteurellaceae bacterium Orientalotternb1]
MSNEIQITTKVCRIDNMNSCNDVFLKVPQSEAVKLQIVEHSNNPDLGQFNMNYLMSGFGLVLFCYVLSYGVGQMLKMIR